MEKTVYEDYKYSIQDAANIYVGSKYTFQEILDNEDINFRLRLVINKYVLSGADPQDSVETHLYYLEKGSFLVKLYDRLKMRIKANVVEEKKGLLHKGRKEYVTRNFTIRELTALGVEEKKELGLVIQEVKISKLALLSI